MAKKSKKIGSRKRLAKSGSKAVQLRKLSVLWMKLDKHPKLRKKVEDIATDMGSNVYKK